MKKLLILIITTALFLHFFPQPEISAFYDDQKKMLQDNFADFSETKVNLKSEIILMDLEPNLDQFSPEEMDYLKEITLSKSNVKVFFEEHCQQKKHHEIFHTKNQSIVCEKISRYKSRL